MPRTPHVSNQPLRDRLELNWKMAVEIFLELREPAYEKREPGTVMTEA